MTPSQAKVNSCWQTLVDFSWHTPEDRSVRRRLELPFHPQEDGEAGMARDPSVASAAPPGRKSDRTRAAILSSAREHFRSHGYDRTSIRTVAASAGIDPSMVMRYYGSKEGLFAAAVDVDLQLPHLADVPARRRGQALLEHFVRRWEGDLSDDVLVLLLRSAVTDQRAAERLQGIFREQVVGTLAQLYEPAEARRRAGLIASQTLGLALGRYLLKIPGLVDRPAEDLVADLAPTIQRYLSGPLPTNSPERRSPTRRRGPG